ncbi:MAG: ATP-binding protein [Candidatus Delongbacteria bacterium]
MGLPPVVQHHPAGQDFSDICLSTTHDVNQNLFVGNDDGVLEFDGQTWRRLQTPGRTQIRSVLALPDGRLAYGGTNEFGWLERSAGDWQPRHLSDSLRDRAPHFRDVRSIHHLSHGLYFQSKELLARWQGGQLQTFTPPQELGGAAALGDTLFVQLADRGLCRLNPARVPEGALQIPETALEPVLGPELFAQGNRMVCLLPLDGGRLLLGTRFRGLYLLERGRVTALPELSARIQALDLFHGLRLRDGRLALATLQGGVFLLDPQLRVQQVLDERTGLSSPMAVHLSQDAGGNLWVASTDGVAEVALELPFSQYMGANGLPGQPQCLTLHEGWVHVGTTQGLFRMREGRDAASERFVRVGRVSGICWHLLSTRHGLLATLGGQLAWVREAGDRVLLGGQPSLLFQDPEQADRVWVGVEGRLRPLLWEAGAWRVGEPIPGVMGDITSMERRVPGEYWLGSSDTGLWRIRLRQGRWDVLNLGVAQGLEPGAVQVRSFRDQLLVVSGTRVLEPDSAGRLGEPGGFAPPAGWNLGANCRISRGLDGSSWVLFQQGLAVAPAGKGLPVWDTSTYGSAGRRPRNVLVTRDGIWVQTEQRLLHYHPDQLKAAGHELPPLQLRSLELGGVQWAGTAGGLRPGGGVRGVAPLVLGVACAHLGLDGPAQYSFLVEGLDEEWTPWTLSGTRRLDYLPPGRYTLRVRVQAGSHPVQETELGGIHVPAPWYKWLWLQTLALGALLGLSWLLARRRAQRLKGMNAALQAEVQERRRAEGALRVSESRYRGLFENALDAIFVMDSQRFLEGNPAAARLFGLAPEEMAGLGPEMLSPPQQPDGRDSREKAQELIQRALAGEALSFEWIHLRSSGQPFLVEVTLSLLHGGSEPLLLAILRDVSERHQLESQLRQSQKMEAVGRLAGGVAHDFNNILVVILGQCDLLLMSLDSHDPVRDELQQVRDAAQRAAQLTRQLLIFSRRSTLHPQRVSLNGILADLEKMLRRVIGEDIRIRLDLAPDLQRVNLDTGQMDQVILNLVVNARDAMPGGGELVIRTRNVVPGALLARETGLPEGAPHVLLSISDTGHGMSSEVQAHIFEPFFTTKEAGQGTGLGLATVYGIVTQSGGLIRVQSELGQGTSFHIYLPAVLGESLAGRDGEPRELSGPGGTERLLLVEDEAAVREVLLRTLRNSGYEVSTAANGREALALLEQGLDPQLILSDVVMPELGGFELVRQVRDQGLLQPVILMTGYTDRGLDLELMDGQNVSLLSKPFGPGVLLREVRSRLDGPRSESTV